MRNLEQAIEAGDPAAALEIAPSLTRFIEAAPPLIAQAPRSQRAELQDKAARIGQQISTLLARAPVPSRSAIQAGLLGDWAQWDREAAEWKANLASDAVVGSKAVEERVTAVSSHVVSAAPAAAPRTSPTTPSKSTHLYVNQHRAAILAAIADRIERTGVSQPHPRLRWSSLEDGARAVAHAIRTFVDAVPDQALNRLMTLSYPADLFRIISDARSGPGGIAAAALAAATAFDVPVLTSITQMGTRLRVHLDVHGAPMPPATALVASTAMDRIVGEVLVQRGVLVADWSKRKTDDTPATPFARGVREVEYEWMGSRDPRLWNWIRVTSPKNATAEDVAHTPLARGEVIDGSEQAHRIAASPPFFGIPFETAKLVPEAIKYAPPALRKQLERGDHGPRITDLSPLATSALSDDAALAQAPAPSKVDPPVAVTLERASLQLTFLRTQLVPWKASARLAGATQFIERRSQDSAKDSPKWTSVLARQERVLHGAASEVAEILTQLKSRGATPADARQLGPVMDVVEAYAHAAGVSHLASESRRALAEARNLRALLPLALTEEKIRIARAAVSGQQAAEHQAGNAKQSGETAAMLPSLATRAADLRLSAAKGHALDQTTIDQLAVDADETALRARLIAIKSNVRAVVKRAEEVGLSSKKFEGGLPTVHAMASVLLDKRIPAWLATLDKEKRWHGPLVGLTQGQTMATQMRSAITTVETQLATFDEVADIRGYLEWADEQIKDKELSNKIRSLAIQLGIMILAGQMATAAVAALRGIALGTSLISELRGAGLAYKAAEIAIQAGLATGANAFTGGPVNARVFAENALGILITSAAMKPFQGLFHSSAVVEQEIRTWTQLAKRSGKFAVEMAVDTGVGIGASAVAHALTHGEPSIATGEEWITQGISFAASRFVGQRTQAMERRITDAAQSLGPKPFSEILSRLRGLTKRANNAKDPSAAEALAMLHERQALLIEERKIYKQLAESSDATKGAIANNTKAASEADGAMTSDFLDAPLRLSGLSAVVDGHVYEGTKKQIESALSAARATGLRITASLDAKAGTWRVKAGNRTVLIHDSAVHSTQNATAKPSSISREQLPGELATHQRAGATVRPVADAATRAFDIEYPDGRRLRIMEAEAARVRPGTGERAPTPKEAARARAVADRAAKVQTLRDNQLTELINNSSQPVVIDTAIIGAGQAATLTHATLEGVKGAAPGVAITEVPQVINIAPEGSMFANHGSFRIGQKPGELRGPDSSRQPGEFTSKHDAPIAAQDFVRSLTMTSYEAGMVTYRTTVTEVQQRPPEGWGPGVTGAAADMPIRVIAGGKTLYVRRVISAAGLGAPASLGPRNPKIAAQEPALIAAGKLIYAQHSLTLPGKRDHVVVVGDGAVGVWACEAALRANPNAQIYWVGVPPKPGAKVSPEMRAALSEFMTETQMQIYVKAWNARNAATFQYIKEGKIKLQTVLTEASIDPGTSMVKVKFGDSDSELRVDGIVVATGQNLDTPKGMRPGELGFKEVFVDHRGKLRLVALDAVDPDGRELGIRLVGAQLAKAELLLPEDRRPDFRRQLEDQATDTLVPRDSQGVIGSIYQNNIDIPLANANDRSRER
jgi:hypothetical protein